MVRRWTGASEDHLVRDQWSRARMDAIHPGRDGLIRSVTLLEILPAPSATPTPFGSL